MINIKFFNLIKIVEMTCFWSGIIRLLDYREINKVLDTNFLSTPPERLFIRALKAKNINVTTIKHNGNNLEYNQIKENFEHIKSINIKQIGKGYLCSGCEPVLFLISYLFGYDIKHIINDTAIYYAHPNPIGKLTFGSNSIHFYPIRKHFW